MSRANAILEPFVNNLQAVQGFDDLRAMFDRTVDAMGFRYFTYHIVKIAGVGCYLPYVITTYPDEWVTHYIAQDYVRIDPLIAIGPKRLVPFLWDDIAAPHQLEGRQVTLFSEAAELSIGSGMSIPIHGHNGEFAMMSVVPAGTRKEAENTLAEYRNTLHLLALYYHNYAGTILIEKSYGGTRKKSVLTARERECLQWAAIGKSTWETSMILHISEASVVFHIENAKRKLDVTNRTHAVVRAIMLGLISLD